jgi:hypothetical protein
MGREGLGIESDFGEAALACNRKGAAGKANVVDGRETAADDGEKASIDGHGETRQRVMSEA